MLFFTSDTHFNDKPKAQKRGFSAVEAMNETIITRWNEKVSPHDDVYHLGDLFVGGVKEGLKTLAHLNGRIHLIAGNHDKHHKHIAHHVEELHIYQELLLAEGHFVLFHYPIASWNGMKRGSYHLHGHVHSNDTKLSGIPKVPRRLNISTDSHNYTPLSLPEVMQLLSV